MSDRRPLIATYMTASRPFGVVYTGVTSNLYARASQHRHGKGSEFTTKHRAGMLVWFEVHEMVTAAIRREKALKSWNRAWKMQLIEQRNPDWRDLYPFLVGEEPDPRLPLPEDGQGSVAKFLRQLDSGELGEG